MKKDRLFIVVLSLVAAQISYQLFKTLAIASIRAEGIFSFRNIIIILANAIAITGVLWLLQNYRQRRRIKNIIDREKEEEEEKEENSK